MTGKSYPRFCFQCYLECSRVYPVEPKSSSRPQPQFYLVIFLSEQWRLLYWDHPLIPIAYLVAQSLFREFLFLTTYHDHLPSRYLKALFKLVLTIKKCLLVGSELLVLRRYFSLQVVQLDDVIPAQVLLSSSRTYLPAWLCCLTSRLSGRTTTHQNQYFIRHGPLQSVVRRLTPVQRPS